MTDVIIYEPLTYTERQAALAFVAFGYEVEILPPCLDYPEDFRLDTGESINVIGVYKPTGTPS